MKLYLTPGACSLADHIALREAGMEFDTEVVDLATRRTASGADFLSVNPKGYVPALMFDDREVLTENVAILAWVAAEVTDLRPEGRLGAARLIEALSFIATEIHRPFMRLFFSPAETEQAEARNAIERRLALIADRMRGPCLFGARFSAADPFLWVMTGWAIDGSLTVPDRLRRFHAAVAERPAVCAALHAEGLAA